METHFMLISVPIVLLCIAFYSSWEGEQKNIFVLILDKLAKLSTQCLTEFYHICTQCAIGRIWYFPKARQTVPCSLSTDGNGWKRTAAFDKQPDLTLGSARVLSLSDRSLINTGKKYEIIWCCYPVCHTCLLKCFVHVDVTQGRICWCFWTKYMSS